MDRESAVRYGSLIIACMSFSAVASLSAGQGKETTSERGSKPGRFVHVNGYQFDPLGFGSSLPSGLRYAALPEEVRTAYIVQFHSRITGTVRLELESLGLRVLGYLPEDSYLVEADGRQIAQARKLPAVRWAGPLEPAHKLSSNLEKDFDRILNEAAEQMLGKPEEVGRPGWAPVDTTVEIPVTVRALGHERVSEVGRLMSEIGVKGLAEPPQGGEILGGVILRGAIARLAHHPGVLWIERREPVFLANDRAAWTVMSNDPLTRERTAHLNNLSGLGQTITIADTGIDWDHTSFLDTLPGGAHKQPGSTHRKITAYYVPGDGGGDCNENPDPAPIEDPDALPTVQHGTHVAGTIVGDDEPWTIFDGSGLYNPGDPYALHDGIAFRGQIQVQDLNRLSFGIQAPTDLHDLFRPAVDPSARVSAPGDCPPVTPAAPPSFIHSNSWGRFSGPKYSAGSLQIDDSLWDPTYMPLDPNDHRNLDLLVLFAAGNSGPDPFSLGEFAASKNALTVGASGNADQSNNFATPSYNDRRFSSRGPTCDGRIKPDVMAPGRSLWSAMGCDPVDPDEPGICQVTGGNCATSDDCPHQTCTLGTCFLSGAPCGTAEDCNREPCNLPPVDCLQYRSLTGTSMATPATAGAAALIREYFLSGYYPTGEPNPNHVLNPSAALLKATLINGAVEMTGLGAYENGQNSYPNSQQGWGRIHLDESLYFQGDTQWLEVHDERIGVTQGQTLSYPFQVAPACGPLEVTLVWNDAPPALPINCNTDPNYVSDPTLVNDLDLVVRSPQGNVFRGNYFAGTNPGYSLMNPSFTGDRRNNVEGVVVIPGLEAGSWQIEVTGHSIPMGHPNAADPNLPLQPFALVIGCNDSDDDDDGDLDWDDCAPQDGTRHSGATEICDGADNDCDGQTDEGFPNTDGDSLLDCLDPDDDNDGDLDATDCAPLDAAIHHGVVEALPQAGGQFGSCHDGIDNDCDLKADMDCAIDVDAGGQSLSSGTVSPNDLALIRAASAQTPETYEIFTEGGSGNKKKLTAVWNYSTTASAGTAYELHLEAHRPVTSNDDYIFSYLSRASTAACDPNEAGWSTTTLTVNQPTDTGTTQTLPVGPLVSGKLCARVLDSAPSGDSSPSTLTLDRLYLFPAKPACPDGDSDGYAATCTGCNNAQCPAIDCNDGNALLSPGTVEGPPSCGSCSDGLDNNCSGQADAADLSACGPRPDDSSRGDYQTGPGEVLSGSAEDIASSDTLVETLRETLSQGKSKLKHTWVFQVPAACSHTLVIEGTRPANGEGDNFQFSWASDPSNDANFTTIPGAIIDKIFVPAGGIAIPFATPGAPATIYIRVVDTNQTSGTALDTVNVNRLRITTP